MHFAALFSLVFFATLASHVQAAREECCGCDRILLSPTRYGFCDDHTPCTPYCGYGPCNIFGCNCDGGCREQQRHGYYARSFAHTGLAAAGATEDRFNAADTNNDGHLTFGEWAATHENKNMDNGVLAAHWAKFDNANVGYLTKADVASRIA